MPVTSTASEPSVVRRPWALTSSRNFAANLRSMLSSSEALPQLVASQQISDRQRPHSAKWISHGADTSLPLPLAAVASALRETCEHACACRSATGRTPAACRRSICALASASISSGWSLLRKDASTKSFSLTRNWLLRFAARLQQTANSLGRQQRLAVQKYNVASNAEACVPLPASERARLAASSNAREFAISVAEVTIPRSAPRRWHG